MRVLLAIVLFYSSFAFSAELYTEGIVQKDLGLKPAQLVSEYVKRDANGEFLGTNDWWNTAVACPACMGGPDTFKVISAYEIKKVNELTYTAAYKTEGTITGSEFTPEKKDESQSFTVVKTQWGFKLDQKAYLMVYADMALKKYRGQLTKASIELLKAVKVKKASEAAYR